MASVALLRVLIGQLRMAMWISFEIYVRTASIVQYGGRIRLLGMAMWMWCEICELIGSTVLHKELIGLQKMVMWKLLKIYEHTASIARSATGSVASCLEAGVFARTTTKCKGNTTHTRKE